MLYKYFAEGSFHAKSSDIEYIMLVFRKFWNFYHNCVREKEKLWQNLRVVSQKLTIWGQILKTGGGSTFAICVHFCTVFKAQYISNKTIYGTVLKFGGFAYL